MCQLWKNLPFKVETGRAWINAWENCETMQVFYFKFVLPLWTVWLQVFASVIPSAVIRGDDQSKICNDKDILEKKIETLEEKLKTQDSDHNEYSI